MCHKPRFVGHALLGRSQRGLALLLCRIAHKLMRHQDRERNRRQDFLHHEALTIVIIHPDEI